MRNFAHILVAMAIAFSSSAFSQSEKLIENLPANVEGVYAGITTLSFFNYDQQGNSWFEHNSKVQVALQTKFDSPIGEIKFKSAHEFMSNTTIVNVFVHNQWNNVKFDIGYKALPVTSLNRNFPFVAGGQFEYESQKILDGSAPSINLEYTPVKAISLFYGFAERPVLNKRFIPEHNLGVKFNLNNVVAKLAVSQNSNSTQAGLTLEGYGIVAMTAYSKKSGIEKVSGYIDWNTGKILGNVYADIVRENGQDSYMEFGQYWTKRIFKDVLMHVGYGYSHSPNKDFIYVYSFIHI